MEINEGFAAAQKPVYPVDARYGQLTRVLLTFAEAAISALALARIAFGPISVAPSQLLWLTGMSALAVIYLALDWLVQRSYYPEGFQPQAGSWRPVWISSLPFMLIFSGLLLLLTQPELSQQLLGFWTLPAQPLPVVGVVISLALVFTLKALIHSSASSSGWSDRVRALTRVSDPAIIGSMLLLGVLQTSIYLTPIGNAFLRFWAIADAVGSGVPYPVTLTEPDPISAGSPPYVYDLGLFPLMLKASFFILGHNSTAAHIPSAVFSALFPLSMYLLIKQATGSRLTAIVFGAMASLFPYLRLWVLNLPDPDPVLLTSLCMAGYFYLRAVEEPKRPLVWLLAGLFAGALSLARPEGILYAAFLGLGILASRPAIKRLVLFATPPGIFVGAMAAIWITNFGFVWPQNYNRTLGLDYPLRNYEILLGKDALGIYQRGLGLDVNWAIGILALFLLSVLFGGAVMLFKNRYLLALAVPAVGNTVIIFFANPFIPNTYHFADFFRHASFGLPILVLMSAYAFHWIYRHLAARRGLRLLAYASMLLLVLTVVREGDIMANPTATHRPEGNATQVLTATTHLSLQSIVQNPMSLPPMGYYYDGQVTVARAEGISWPEDSFDFFKPLDMAFDSTARSFGYGSVMLFLLALLFALSTTGRMPASAER